jgi:integrase
MLTETKLKQLKWEGKDKRVADRDGLYLLIRKQSRSWLFRSRKGGKEKFITIGHYPFFSLKEAREAVSEMYYIAHNSSVTTKAVCNEVIKEIYSGYSNPDQYIGYIDRAILPGIGSKYIQDVTRQDLAKLITSYRSRGARGSQVLLSNLRTIFGYAHEMGYIEDNPAIGLTKRITGYTYKPKQRILSEKEIQWLFKQDNNNAQIARFLLLTGLRIGEHRDGGVIGSKWVLNGTKTKTGKDHWVHLSELAQDQLGFKPRHPTTVNEWLRDNQPAEDKFTPHDLRRTAVTLMNEEGVQPFIVERTIGHSLQGLMKVYNQADYEEERINAIISLESRVKRIVCASPAHDI